jgi:glycerol-3-phosphate dehydrogenase
LFDRESIVNQLAITEEWDIIIIGGGATGLGTALDATTRGYKTLLLESVDFAKGTSSRSTKLVHGGVRYLAQGQVDLVREALRERGLLMKNASHLVTNQSFIIPNYSLWNNWFYTIGLKVYDLLSGKFSFGKSIRVNQSDMISRFSTLKTENLKGGVQYYDGQFDDSRLAVNMAQTCIEQGATVINHCKVTSLIKDSEDKVIGVNATNSETDISYKLLAKVVVNATGVFADDILRMDNPSAKKSIRPSQGIHLVFDRSVLPGNDAIMIPKTDDGRVLFLVPWHNKVIAGTTDTLLDKPSYEPIPLDEEIDFILNTANQYLEVNVSKSDVLSVFSGLRPLAAPKHNSTKTKEISRSHKILVSKSGLVSITGGKWTTYRKMAKDAIDKIISLRKLPKAPCATKELSIHGASNSLDRSSHLYIYGSDKEAIESLIQNNQSLGKRIHPRLEFTIAEIVYAVRNEMARTIDDVLARRVRILFLDAKAAIEVAPLVGDILQSELNKTDEWKQQQIEDFNQIAQHYILK